MKGTPLLVLLLALASLAGGVLYYKHRSDLPPAPLDTAAAVQAFVDEALKVDGATPTPLQTVTPETLRARIGANLDARFGPGGLAHRTRAFELLGLLPSGQNLHGQFVAMQAAGCRAWFDDLSGALLVAPDFDPATRNDDRAALVRLRTREALFQAGLTLPTGASDDEWVAHRALHGGLAAALELADRQAAGLFPDLPTAEQIERESILLSLPIYVHNLAQADVLIGLDHVRRQREEHHTPWLTLARHGPGHTHGLLGISEPSTPPTLPPTPGTILLEESLGAYSTQLLLESHSDYAVAESLSPDWRGDRYRLFTNGRGDHCLWLCQWATPAAATQAAEVLRATLPPPSGIPGSEPRHQRIDTIGSLLRLLNCADPETLESLQTPAP